MARILLVEDNEMNSDILSRRLARKGFEIEIARDGQQGVDMARNGSPDLILLDMSLPVLSGWDAARIIKESPATHSIPLIALTAHAGESERDSALQAGCDDFDTKPIDFSRLLEKIETLLRVDEESRQDA